MEKINLKRFFKNLLIFTALLVAADRIIGYALEKAYFSLKAGQFAQTTYTLDKAAPDILVFGSSRALHHYSSSILSDKLHKSIYNAGSDGQFLPYYCAAQEVILQRKIPKIIILDVNIWELGPNDSKYIKLASLLPYVSEHPILKKYTAEISDYENIKFISKTYPYNSTLLISAYDHLFSNKLPSDDRGYFPLVRTIPKQQFEHYREQQRIYNEKRAKQKIKIDMNAVDYYRAFLQRCEDLKIKTYVIISPTILKEPKTKEKILLKIIAEEYPNVTFLDYSSDATYNNHYKLFADEFHLNDTGAKKFSEELADKIK
ncbi:hypothetical protein I5M32_11900 [Pedobacter sp. SD-b]|uniref:SGNH/GDSL hydrolase family protein n=1 Tax=Pedobacter segetis TaxID=2793069 RepID=A0ABS1BLA9_9SPHI|nr:hypothetical protein [Pedobacter segetis]MBK0383662.1 hypothetical protein [Pedobacter segetis]